MFMFFTLIVNIIDMFLLYPQYILTTNQHPPNDSCVMFFRPHQNTREQTNTICLKQQIFLRTHSLHENPCKYAQSKSGFSYNKEIITLPKTPNNCVNVPWTVEARIEKLSLLDEFSYQYDQTGKMNITRCKTVPMSDQIIPENFYPESDNKIDEENKPNSTREDAKHHMFECLSEEKLCYRRALITDDQRILVSHFILCIFNNLYSRDLIKKKVINSDLDPFVQFYRKSYDEDNDKIDLKSIYDSLNNQYYFFTCFTKHSDFSSPFVCLSKLLLIEFKMTFENVIDDFTMIFEGDNMNGSFFFSSEESDDEKYSIIDLKDLINSSYWNIPQFRLDQRLSKFPKFFLVTNLNYKEEPTYISNVIRYNGNVLFHMISFITYEEKHGFITFQSENEAKPETQFVAHSMTLDSTINNLADLPTPPVFMFFVRTPINY